MAFTETWSFNSGFNGWTFSDESFGSTSSTTRTWIAGAIRIVMFIPSNPPNDRQAIGYNISPNINAPVANNDTIEFDYSVATGTVNQSSFRLTVTYTDTTTELQNWNSVTGAGTKTFTITQNKTMDFFSIRYSISAGGVPTPARTVTRDLEEVRLITAGAIVPTAGLLRTPEAFIDDEGAAAAGGAGGGSGGNLADISADGLSIYIASFNNFGFPTLIKMPAPLNADGSVVFDPGDGGRIGVQTGELNAETVWIAGNFGGTDMVEKSEDAGVSFTVKDDASFGTVRTFQVGGGDDGRLLVFDGDNGDILETLDDGVTWTTINAAVTPLINSIARLSTNLPEIIAGNEGAANDSIDYSPNSGVNLEDYQTGVYPNADATKVQVT